MQRAAKLFDERRIFLTPFKPTWIAQFVPYPSWTVGLRVEWFALPRVTTIAKLAGKMLSKVKMLRAEEQSASALATVSCATADE